MRPGLHVACWMLIIGVLLSLTFIPSSADDNSSAADVADDSAPPASDASIDNLPVVGYDALAPYPLNQIVEDDFENVTVRDLAKWIEEEFDVPVQMLDTKSLGYEEDEIAAWADETRISVNSFQQRLYTVLRRADAGIDDDELTPEFVVRDGVVVFGPRYAFEEGDYPFSIVNYEVSDLLDGPFDVESLREVLHKNTSGEWAEIDGVGGEIDHYRGVLIVRQTDAVQQEIAHLLAILRHPRVPVMPLYGLVDEYEIEQRLKQPITLSLTNISFDQAIGRLSKEVGVPMRINAADLAENGYGLDALVSLSAESITADLALESLLESYSEQIGETDHELLTTITEDGEKVIVTASRCYDFFHLVLYDVSDFATTPEQQETFNKLLMNQTSGEWFDIDGIGGDIQVLEPGWIILRCDELMLREIDKLLAEWRSLGLNDATRDRFPAVIQPPWQPAIQTTYYIMHADTAADLLSSLPERVEPGTWKDADHPDAIGKISMIRLGIIQYTPPAAEDEYARDDDELAASAIQRGESSADKIEFPGAFLIIEHDASIVAKVTGELRHLSPETWQTTGGGFQLQFPVQPVLTITKGEGWGGGFFQMP